MMSLFWRLSGKGTIPQKGHFVKSASFPRAGRTLMGVLADTPFGGLSRDPGLVENELRKEKYIGEAREERGSIRADQGPGGKSGFP
jgi:hypothetical protein